MATVMAQGIVVGAFVVAAIAVIGGFGHGGPR